MSNVDTEKIVDKFSKLLIIGGDIDSSSSGYPRGGFLPIFPCKKKTDNSKNTENREFFQTKKTGNTSIKDILASRRRKSHSQDKGI